MNYWVFPVAALVPLIIGSIWYNPKVFGTAWLGVSGLTEEEAQSGNMAVIFGLTFVFSLMLSTVLYTLVVHQAGMVSLMVNEEGYGVAGSDVMNFFAEYPGMVRSQTSVFWSWVSTWILSPDFSSHFPS